MSVKQYDFPIDHLNPNNSHGKALSQVREGSKVLECGSATGCMTKYMKERMGCNVTIIEIDHEGFIESMRYADAGYCTDLNTPYWYEDFCGEQFDYVLFVDVLEHLTNPLGALQQAVKLLAPGGKIIISIPNICHNDIIIKMYYDCFTYTQIGLLDATHIHFWGVNDIAAFCDSAGLKITHSDVIQVGTGHTEQRIPKDKVDEDLAKALSKRTFGNVYQFVITCEKKG